ncbi:nuclear pore RNA shuttling protein Mtr2 [Scheffersomyces amazonensis]|uniref:nuclear pore RNA shuttling protein Mtr2 n=1 Tax=Scheffersomyces amazonensis TaxID=1078765 RepID=UPI00315D2C53
MSQIHQDITQPIEPFLKKFLNSLDIQYASTSSQYPNVEAYATQFGKALKPSSAIIINGAPVIPAANSQAKLEFQKKWLQSPLSFHQLNSYDCHLIPGTGTFIINLSAKVRFDESGRNRLGESADIIPDPQRTTRPLWGSWFGVNITLVVDQTVMTNDEAEIINSLNYRFTFKPEDTVIKI